MVQDFVQGPTERRCLVDDVVAVDMAPRPKTSRPQEVDDLGFHYAHSSSAQTQ